MAGDDTSTFPEYLNKDFFTTCLRNGLNRADICVDNFQISVGTNPGDNYTSYMYRVVVQYKESNGNNETANLMVKSMPTDGDRAFLEEINMYGKETGIYLDILPKIHKNVNSRIAPKCYYATRHPIQTIVFEDLKSQGYALDDRVVGLDEDRCRLVLEKLAKFHAGGMYLVEKAPELQNQFRDGFFSADSVGVETFQIFFRKNLRKAAEIVTDMPEYKHFAPQLLALFNNFPTVALQSVAKHPEDTKTINHGDVWVNNIMFRYNDNKTPTDALLVDFQSSFVNSPAFDLNYFFVTSCQLDLLKKKDEMVEKYYYPIFVETLRAMGIEVIPSLDKILGEMRQRELFSLFNLIGSFPLISLEWEESKTNGFAQFFDESIASKKRNVGMASQRFLETMKYCLKYYEKLNTINIALRNIE